jgi:hypothetical protein
LTQEFLIEIYDFFIQTDGNIDQESGRATGKTRSYQYDDIEDIEYVYPPIGTIA